ncbi:hypothetical protein ACZ87_01765 [Candidatus Erwinia dacicola]|uniref:Uncharacterized protein n=1 Tax=Candidatus Erwinia dacicola TaxID=252393 RepID=A0A328TPW8_9GAMM|nr:hypothetical protein ACZ87_01765 [Candidatus Erwinia dacicola]
MAFRLKTRQKLQSFKMLIYLRTDKVKTCFYAQKLEIISNI